MVNRHRVVAAIALTALFSLSAFAQAPDCVWTGGAGKVTQECGDVGVGTAPPNLFGATSSRVVSIVSAPTAAGRGVLELGTYNAAFSHYAGLLVFLNLTSGRRARASIYVQANASGTNNDLGYSMQFLTKPDAGVASERLRIDSSGDVGIGIAAPAARLHVVGNALIAGTLEGTNIIAKYQDVAEWVPTTSDLRPGSVVVLDSDRVNVVTESRRPYDEMVAGVVSAQPGVLLGEAGNSKEMIATTGRVRVRVDARKAPIKIGDLLVTSDAPGAAMRSERIVINGGAIHRPGTIIGKALEPMPTGDGEILVLLSLQ